MTKSKFSLNAGKVRGPALTDPLATRVVWQDENVKTDRHIAPIIPSRNPLALGPCETFATDGVVGRWHCEVNPVPRVAKINWNGIAKAQTRCLAGAPQLASRSSEQRFPPAGRGIGHAPRIESGRFMAREHLGAKPPRVSRYANAFRKVTDLLEKTEARKQKDGVSRAAPVWQSSRTVWQSTG